MAKIAVPLPDGIPLIVRMSVPLPVAMVPAVRLAVSPVTPEDENASLL